MTKNNTMNHDYDDRTSEARASSRARTRARARRSRGSFIYIS